MTEQDTLPKKPKKFFFDTHHFDDGYEEEIEEDIPPPPVFSEDELAIAKRDSYEQGRKDALAEAERSREKFVSSLLEKITDNFSTLFDSEEKRAAQYESEAVHLATHIFKSLFPALNQKHGIDEIKSAIKAVLDTQNKHPEIIIAVHPDYTDDIKSYLKGIEEKKLFSGTVNVIGNETLNAADCLISWDDGGAKRDITALSEQIRVKLEDILADKPSLQDNRDKQDKAEETTELKTNTGTEAEPSSTSGEEE